MRLTNSIWLAPSVLPERKPANAAFAASDQAPQVSARTGPVLVLLFRGSPYFFGGAHAAFRKHSLELGKIGNCKRPVQSQLPNRDVIKMRAKKGLSFGTNFA